MSYLEISASQASALVMRAFPDTSRPISKIMDDIRDWYPDSSLVAPTPRDLVNIAKKIPPRPWTKSYDCDDFARSYYCKALSERTDDLTWCVGLANFETTPAVQSAHRMNISIADIKGKATVLVMEPQKTGSGAAAHFLRRPSDKYRLRCCILG